jgi:hypothetical protein
MKTLKNILAIELFILFLLVSCSIEKRHYLPGYHIEWEGRNKKSNVPLKMARKDLVDQTNKNSVSILKDPDAVIMFAPASTAKERRKYVPITKVEGRIGLYERQNTVAYNNRKNASIPNRNNQKEDKK